VPHAEKKRRLHAVEDQQREILKAHRGGQVGTTVQVLVEGPASRKGRGGSNTTLGEPGTAVADDDDAGTAPGVPGRWGGRTATNTLVFFDSVEDPTGRLIDVEVTKASPWFLEGVSRTPVVAASRRVILPMLA